MSKFQCVYAVSALADVWESEDNLWQVIGSRLSPGIKSRSSGLLASVFTGWAISQAPQPYLSLPPT